MISRFCWYDKTRSCYCEEDKFCIEIVMKFMKLVYCADNACAFNLEVPYDFVPDKGMNYKPFKDDVVSGVCTRKDLVLSPIKTWELKTNKKLTTCRMRADKSLKRPKFPDADHIEGGSYPDPVDPHAAYH